MANTSMPAPRELLRAFSTAAPSNCTAERIDFTKLGLHGCDGEFAVLIHNMLTPEECRQLLQAAEETQSHQWEAAQVNVGAGQQKLMTDVRLCGRIIWDSFEVADLLKGRILPHLPEDIITLKDRPKITGPGPSRRKETWALSRLNERLRFLKYTKGMYFHMHRDGSYVTPDEKEISFLTVHIYLNSQSEAGLEPGEDRHDAEKPLVGGATRFFGLDQTFHDVNPATGACLVFQHRGLYHSGEEVEQGTKYTVRTDIQFRRKEDEEA